MKLDSINLIKSQILLGVIFTLLHIYLLLRDRADINTDIFAFIIYEPFVFLLAIYNGIMILILALAMGRSIFVYLLPMIPFLILFLLSDYTITIRYWEFDTVQTSIGLAIYSSINIFSYYFLNIVKKNQPLTSVCHNGGQHLFQKTSSNLKINNIH